MAPSPPPPKERRSIFSRMGGKSSRQSTSAAPINVEIKTDANPKQPRVTVQEWPTTKKEIKRTPDIISKPQETKSKHITFPSVPSLTEIPRESVYSSHGFTNPDFNDLRSDTAIDPHYKRGKSAKPKSRPVSPLNPSRPQTNFSTYLERDKEQQQIISRRETTITTSSEKDMEQRQKFIDRLLFELDTKTTAIQRLGTDIVMLRETNHEQTEEITHLTTLLQDADLKTKRLISGFDLEVLDAPELRRRYGLLASKLEQIIESKRNIENEVNELRDEMEEKDKIEKDLKQLRMAHFAQQALVINLQERIKHGDKFKNVIQKQEKVIENLEIQLKGLPNKERIEVPGVIITPIPKLAVDMQQPNNSKLYKLLIKENRDLKQRLSAMELVSQV